MSRRDLLLLGLFLLVGAGALWAYPRLDLFLNMRALDKPFDAYAHPPPPNYADPANWAALPGPDQHDAADLVPPGAAAGDRQAEAAVDVFYIHPTTYRGRENWNQDVTLAETNAWTDASVIARQAAVFNGCCRVYAPRYRQAAVAALAAKDDSGDKARALAYEDVRAAFQFYLDRYNDGRPFILAGHSQGSFYVMKLLADMVDRSPIRERMVAAYAPGVGFTLGQFRRQYLNTDPCATPEAINCVVSWNTFGRGGDGAAAAKRNADRHRAQFKTDEGAGTLCINPLTFDLSKPDAPAAANLGALPGVASKTALPPLKPGLVGATCTDGMLYADIPKDPDFKLLALPGKVLHFHDYDLFFANIRANAIARSAAYLSLHGPAASP